MASEDPNEGGSGRRHPRNMKGLLNFCLEHTQSEDIQNQESLPPMTEERREWLDSALKEMAGTDPVKHMLELIQKVLDQEMEEETREEALEEIQMICEDLDMARDFYKIGGYTMTRGLLSSDKEGLRWRAADLMATLTQNNPVCQKAAMDDQFLPRLLTMIDSTDTDLVRTKALYAVSCICREFPLGQTQLATLDGFSVLMRAMQSQVEKLQIKSSYFIAALCIENPALKDILCDMGMVEQLIAMMRTPHSSFHEHLTRALLNLTDNHKRAQQECRRPELKLRQILDAKIPTLKGQEEWQEELDYSEQLYTLCFNDRSAAPTVDR